MRSETMFRHPIQPYRIKGKVITTTVVVFCFFFFLPGYQEPGRSTQYKIL